MGTALWVASGIGAGFLARIVPIRRGRILYEILVAVLAACLAALIATALDFGGWREADWRAGLFALLVAFASVAVLRMSLLRSAPVAGVSVSQSPGSRTTRRSESSRSQ